VFAVKQYDVKMVKRLTDSTNFSSEDIWKAAQQSFKQRSNIDENGLLALDWMNQYLANALKRLETTGKSSL
jgi:hypothetical protein